jgi:5-methylcytosine-specific restriction protein A
VPTRPPVHRPFAATLPTRRRYSHDGRLTTSSPYDTQAWRRLRRAFIGANPLCKRCEENGLLVAATEVHHKLPLTSHPDLKMSWENLEGLCKSCHSKETAREASLK